VDASVLVTWFLDEEEGAVAVRPLREAYRRGEVEVVVPHLLYAEILNTAGRRRRWSAEALDGLAGRLDKLAFRIEDPALARVARWTAAGLTAYDATYVALAETVGCRVVTTDRQMIELAPALTAPLTAPLTA
jgi:predicted nucleic acid-binding protein